jgi:hypothetical protein
VPDLLGENWAGVGIADGFGSDCFAFAVDRGGVSIFKLSDVFESFNKERLFVFDEREGSTLGVPIDFQFENGCFKKDVQCSFERAQGKVVGRC